MEAMTNATGGLECGRLEQRAVGLVFFPLLEFSGAEGLRGPLSEEGGVAELWRFTAFLATYTRRLPFARSRLPRGLMSDNRGVLSRSLEVTLASSGRLFIWAPSIHEALYTFSYILQPWHDGFGCPRHRSRSISSTEFIEMMSLNIISISLYGFHTSSLQNLFTRGRTRVPPCAQDAASFGFHR